MRIKFLAAGVMAIGFIGLMADVATADLQIQTYIYRDSQGNDQADPVNLLFVGNAVDTYVDAHIASLVGWTYSSGGTMYFDDHGGLQVQDYQRTSAPFWEDHHHVRIEYADDSGQEWYGFYIGYYTAGAAHFDELAACMSIHVASDFDGSRDEVADPFESQSHHVTDLDEWYYVGNHDPSPQCDNLTA